MPLINFDDITPRKRPTQAGLINFNAIAGPDVKLTMPKADAVAPVVRQPTIKQPSPWEQRREAQGKELMQMVANKESAWDNFTTMVDTFNNQMAKNALGTSAPVEGGIAGNRWVDLGASMLTVVAGAEAAVSVLRAAAYSAWLLKQQKSAAFNAKWSGPVVEGWVTGEGTPVVQTVASKNNIPVETARTVVSYVLQNGDTNITPALQAASSLAKATTPQQLQALLPTAVTAMQSANILKSVPAIPLGGKVQPTAQVIAAEGKVAEPQVVTTPTISTDKYEVSHPLPERPNSTAKKHLSLKADADISAFIEKHAALTEKPEAVMDKTVPAINPQKSGSVDITDRVDLASVQVKYPTATTVVLDPKRRTVMFLHDTTPLEAIAIDKPQLKAWYGIDGEKILSEITQPVQPADQPVAPVTTTKQPWEMTLDEFKANVPDGFRVAKLADGDIARAEPNGIITLDPDNFFGHPADIRKEIIAHENAHFVEAKIAPELKARLFDNLTVMGYRGRNINEKLANMIQDGKLPPEVLADYPDLARTAAQPAAVAQPIVEQSSKIIPEQEQTTGEPVPMPEFRRWRYTHKWKNGGAIKPMVGERFTNEELETLENWLTSVGLRVSNPTPTVITVYDDTSNNSALRRLNGLQRYGMRGVMQERIDENEVIQQAKNAQQKTARIQLANQRESAPWILSTFGNQIGVENQIALSDFLEGKTKKFVGMVTPAFAGGAEKIKAATPDGRLDFERVKQAYAESLVKSGGKLEISNDGTGISTPAPSSSSPRPQTTGAVDTGLVPQNLATQEGTSTSDYVMDVSPQSMAAQADRQLNGSREGYVTLNTLNPIHWVNELVKNDPLAKGLDKIGLYTLLYGKEEMAAIRAGRGNPSLFAMRPVPAVVKRNFIWGYGFSPDTLDEMKDVRVRARTMYGKLAELEDQTIKFGKDQFLAMIRFISGFPTGKNTALATSAGKPADPALLPAYDLAEQWGKLEEWLAYNLIHDGQIDPNVFGRLAGRYIPAPYDRMGQMLRPLEEAEHVRPSLVFLKHQSMTPDQIIAFASQGDNWEKYRTFFFQRMRSEIRAAEKGGVFNAIAADPKSGIMPPELAPKKGYVEVDDAMNAFGLKGAAVPQWVADFIHNEFIDVQVAQQLQGYSELLGWYKFLKVGANIPTFIRNVVSQLTVQMVEGNVGPLDLEHYLIKPMGVLLGMDKAGKQELVAMGLWDNNIAREMEGLQFTAEEKALWNTGDRTVAITAFVNRIKNFRSRWSSVYGLADAYTKAATYFANKEQYGARGARNIAFLTSGDYTSRPPIVNFLSRGTRKGKVNPLMFLISNPFAFYRTVVEPQRVGYDLVHHPSLVVGAVAAAYFVIKGVAKRVAKEYDISEEQAAELITELQNYEWLKGRAVLPISGEQAIDLTDLIPMVSYLTTFQQELASHEDLSREMFKWGGLIFGSNNPNFVLNIITTWVTGNDFAAEWRYGRTYRVGDTTWAKLKWTAKQLLPSWITRTLENTKTGNFSITDIIGSYIATASDEDKINFYNSLRKNPQYDAKELNRIYNALFKGTSLTGK